MFHLIQIGHGYAMLWLGKRKMLEGKEMISAES